MRAVVDTNVLISACLKADSSPRHCIRWIQQRGVFLKSHATETEFHLKLAKPRLARLIRDLEFIEHLTSNSHFGCRPLPNRHPPA